MRERYEIVHLQIRGFSTHNPIAGQFQFCDCILANYVTNPSGRAAKETAV